MLRVDVRYAKPGMTLALAVRHPQSRSQVLLRAGFTLDHRTIERMSDMGVRSVWVRYPALEVMSRIVNEDLIEAQASVVSHVIDAFEAAQQQSVARMRFDAYVRSITRMIHDLVSHPRAAMFLGDLDEHEDDQLRRHSANVAYLSVLMGLKLDGYLIRQRRHIDPIRAKEVTNLGLGALLHDIGVLDLPEATRAQYLATGDDNDAAWRLHPLLGFRKLRGAIPPTAATVILNHHQRWDGTGYAGPGVPILGGERIHIFARIVGLAEQFDRMRYPVNAPPNPTVAVLRALMLPRFAERFDPQVLRALLTVTPPYPPGAILRLADGRYAVAIDHNAKHPCRPTVQIIPAPEGLAAEPEVADDQVDPIDLAEAGEELAVVECDGVDVARYNFPPPAIMNNEQLFHAAF